MAKYVGMVEAGVEGGDVEGSESANDIAQKLWMKANTRPCPKCKAPIQKNEVSLAFGVRQYFRSLRVLCMFVSSRLTHTHIHGTGLQSYDLL